MRKTAIKRFHLTGRRPVCRTLKHTGCCYVELVSNVLQRWEWILGMPAEVSTVNPFYLIKAIKLYNRRVNHVCKSLEKIKDTVLLSFFISYKKMGKDHKIFSYNILHYSRTVLIALCSLSLSLT